jgi:pyruvate dehydrogenase E2 component (dihydrolipoamide acetyltransferase)
MPSLEFRLPDIGEGLAEVELVKWLVAVGDAVEENQPIAEVESDKAIVTMPAPASGSISRLCVTEGERLKVGELMVVVDVSAGRPARAATTSGNAAAVPDRAPEQPPVAAATEGEGAAKASPAVRRLARALDVPLESVRGTGPRGRISEEDVRGAAAARTGPAAPTPPPEARPSAEPIETVPFRGLRRRIAEAMTQSVRSIPHVTGFHEFDADALVRLRAALQDRARARGVRLTYLPFIVRAAVRALERFPYLNASLDEAAEAIRLKKFYNIGIATATPAALLVPVVRGADRLSLLDLSREIDRLAQAARDGRLAPGEQADGTFTITNVGGARGWLNTSIIRHPEVAILGVGRIEDRAVVRAGRIVVAPIMPLALTFDHRVVDGDTGLGFMLALREHLEHPELLLFGEPAW